MKKAVLQINNLTTSIGRGSDRVVPVSDVSLQIRKGETFALLGESGCGKSMTALSIMRLLPPSAEITDGDIMLEQSHLLDLSERAMRAERGGRVGMIFQEPMTSLNPVMSIGRQIAEAVTLHDADNSKRVMARVEELLTDVGIPDPGRRMHEYPHQLSGGMKQRVMIAMALAGRPHLLIADEPTTALDVTIQAQVLQLMKELQQQTGMAILLITHDLGVVAEVADRVGIMYAGEIVETADVLAFFERPRHPYSQRLFEALPTPQKRNRPLQAIEGQVPPLNALFSGCRFVERCPYAAALCREQIPQWRGDQNSGFRCHFEEAGSDAVTAAETETVADPTHTETAQSLLDVTDLKVWFPIRRGIFHRTVGHVRAVDGVDLNLSKGKTLALVGESGCGKTTAGKGILQLIRPTAGSVMFNGEQLTALKGGALRRRRADIQLIFQDPASSMNPRMTVEEIIAEGLVVQGISREQRQQRIAEILEQVGLPGDALGRYPHEFSGGQRQRIAIARALILEPQLIICDEPTSALDVSVQAQILNLLKELQQQRQISYLFITHNLAVVSYLADEVAVMYLGRIVELGSVEQILAEPLHPYTHALLSAVPVPDPDSKREVIRLQGDMPSPANPPSGCYFHPRCPQAMDECRRSYPENREMDDGRRLSCHLF
ncbi:MAG TPA: ABC transporter ATP-binding protein [Gammaproteobacteria bacterium]|nr:ABC transporter ATP-binding protein [Gammaproteobacteria bacterium]